MARLQADGSTPSALVSNAAPLVAALLSVAEDNSTDAATQNDVVDSAGSTANLIRASLETNSFPDTASQAANTAEVASTATTIFQSLKKSRATNRTALRNAAKEVVSLLSTVCNSSASLSE